MIELTWLAGPLGLVGLAAAYLLHRRFDVPSAAPAPGQGSRTDSLRALIGMAPVALLTVLVVAGLLWPAVSLPTALAALIGGLVTLALAILGVKAFASSGATGSAAGQKSIDRSVLRAMLATPVAFGLAVASSALLTIGALYFFLIHRSAAFIQTELVDFGNIVGGLGIGVSVVALLIAVRGGTVAGLATAAVDARIAAAVGRKEGSRTDDQLDGQAANLVTGVGGFGTDLLQSIVCATAAAIVIAGTSGSFSVQRVEAVALPILMAAAGLVASGLAVAGTRAIRTTSPAGSLRTLGIVATAIFLVLAFLVDLGLGLDGRDPFSGRAFFESGPFWSILSGSLAGLLIALITEFFTSWRPMRRLVGEGRRLDGTTVVRGIALGLTSAVAPLLLMSMATVAAYFFFGAYGIALAAVGMLGTAGIVAATGTFRPEPSEFDGEVQAGKAEREARTLALGLASIGGSAAAIGRGTAVAVSGMTGVALFTAFSSATGLWAVGIDMQGPLTIAGLMIGTVVPVAVAAIVLSIMPTRTAGADGKGAATRPGPDEVPDRSLYRIVLPTTVAGMLLPVLVGYTLGVQALAGVIAGSVFTGAALAFVFANAGSALLNARLYEQAEAGAGAGSEGVAIGHVARLLCDACPNAINTFVKLIAVSAIVLIPWFVRVL